MPKKVSNLSERLYRLSKRHPFYTSKSKLCEAFECSRSMLYNYEAGNPDPPKEFLDKLLTLEVASGIMDWTKDQPEDSKTPNDSGFPQKTRKDSEFPENPKRFGVSQSGRVPVLGWAHAGAAASYEQLPTDWQESIATDCRDPKAFGVHLEGDSMEPYYREGDTLILMPSEEIHNGCLAVIRFVDDGVIFRRVEMMKGKIRLVPYNKSYEAEDYQCEDISWAYPVYERRTRLWRG